MHTALELHPVPVKSPWNHIVIDFVGPLVKTKSEKKQKQEYDLKHANPKAYELGAKVL